MQQAPDIAAFREFLKAQQATIKCTECKQEFQFEAERRALGNGLYELGIRCPICDSWYHSYFITDEIIRLPRNNRGQRRIYQSQLKRLNKMERKQRGLRKVDGRWISES